MEKLDPPLYFSDWVKMRRKVMDLTQEELAQRSGCSIFTVRKIESGERRPSKQLAELLATSLEIPPEDTQIFVRVARGELLLERLYAPSPESQIPTKLSPQPVLDQDTIPLQPTPLIGRNPELAAMERLFTDPQCRLLSLTGLGGIGKTRLAIEFASKQRSAFKGGVFYIPLAPIKFPSAIIPTVADALGFVFSGPIDPKDQIINFIRKQLKQPVLMIFDNLEHLLVHPSAEEVVDLINMFLHRLPNVKIVITSRERLNMHGEWTYELYGLAVPPSDYPGRLDDFSATALFIQIAKRVKMDYEVMDKEKTAVIRICQMLGGIPLAIELAAAWVGMLSCQEIAQEISSNIGFLKTSMHDIPERHRSIRASFDHSWNLLSGDEQAVLSKISVFNGGFDRIAAEKIAGASLSLLASLNSKSIVYRTDSGRYDLHEVVRQFASTHLKSYPQNIETYKRYAEYYLAYTHKREKSLKCAAQQETIRELAGEMANIRAAWEWAINHREYALAGQAVRGLGWYFEIAGLYPEGIEQLEILAHAIRGEHQQDQNFSKVYGVILIQKALLYFRKGEFRNAQNHYEESIPILRRVGDQALLADALVFLGIILHLSGEYDRAKLLMNEALVYARSSNEKWFEAYAIYNLGYLASLMGEYADGYEQMLHGLKIWREIGDPNQIALGLNFIVPTLNELRRYEEAKAFMHESIALCEQAKNRWGLGTAYRYLGLATMSEGQIIEARSHFYKSLEIFSDFTTGWDIALSLYYLGEVTMITGELSDSRKMFVDTLPHAMEAQAMPIVLDALLGLAQIEKSSGHTENALLLLTFILDNPASTQKTIDRARNLEFETLKLLKNAQIQSARANARTQSLQEIINKYIY